MNTTIKNEDRAVAPSNEAVALQAARRDANLPRAGVAATVFNVLDPIPYGFFVAAFMSDVVYTQTAEVLWVKAAAWLIAAGLVFAVLPRLINLAQVWFPRRRSRVTSQIIGFWLNLLAIAIAIANAFVHSRDAYGVMPEGVWLSSATLILLVLAKVVPTLSRSNEAAS